MWEGPVTYYGPGPGVAGSEANGARRILLHFSGVIRHSAAIIGGYVYRGDRRAPTEQGITYLRTIFPVCFAIFNPSGNRLGHFGRWQTH